MDNIILGAIVGLDGKNPLYNPDERWAIRNIDDIYLGKAGAKKVIPNINDVILEIVGAKISRYIVKSINWVTGIAELVKEESTYRSGVFEEQDVLIGLNGGTGLSTYLCYVDKTTSPYRITVDQRCYMPGSMVTKCKLFRGNLLTSDGEVISRVFDTNGNLTSNFIPMEMAGVVQVSDHPVVENLTIKTVKPAYTTADVKSGEFITAVFYSDEGFVVSKQQLVVEETSFIERPSTGVKYITGISVRSPFITNSTDRIIRYPLNVPLAGLNLIGIVHYSNGETKEYPVDGTKFRVLGFETYMATQIGQRFKVVISYALSAGERNYSAVVGSGNHIALEYEAITQPVDGSYGVKLYCYPRWVDAVNGYRLEWWLYNLNREIAIPVTQHVVINTSVTPYDPIGYGRLQNLSVSINLKRVSPQYRDYIHTQMVGLVIERQGTERVTNWSVIYTPGQSPAYGTRIFAAAHFLGTDRFRINLASGCTTQAEWLDRVYRATQPLTNPATETAPLLPTRLKVVLGDTVVQFPIENWDKDFIVNHSVANSSTLPVQFVRDLSSGQELQLSVAGMPVYYVDVNGVVLV